MKGDANMKVPRETWTLAKEYAEKHGLKIRDFMASAVEAYLSAKPQPVDHNLSGAVDPCEKCGGIDTHDWAKHLRPEPFFPAPLSPR